MDLTCAELAEQIAEIMEYDDRQPPRWQGYVGHSGFADDQLVLTRSYASPREGVNQERLVIKLENQRVRLVGFDEQGRNIRVECPVSLDVVLKRVHHAVNNGIRTMAGIVHVVRTGEIYRHGDERPVEYQF